MVFGDNYNDMEMLEMAGFPIAMEKAVPELKAVSRYQTGRWSGFWKRCWRERSGTHREEADMNEYSEACVMTFLEGAEPSV